MSNAHPATLGVTTRGIGGDCHWGSSPLATRELYVKRPLNIKTKLMGKGLEVSTVLVGRDETERARRAHHKRIGWMFETIVFHRLTGGAAWDTDTYATEEEARRGHRSVVEKWKAKPRKDIRDELAKRKEAESS